MRFIKCFLCVIFITLCMSNVVSADVVGEFNDTINNIGSKVVLFINIIIGILCLLNCLSDRRFENIVKNIGIFLMVYSLPLMFKLIEYVFTSII